MSVKSRATEVSEEGGDGTAPAPPIVQPAGPPAASRGTALTFAWLICAMAVVNMDAGATSAVTVDFSKGCKHEFPKYPCLTSFEVSLLGALPFVGQVVGSPVASLLLNRLGAKAVIVLGLLGQMVAEIVFSSVIMKVHLFICKFIIGFAYAAFRIYLPIWVDWFGPPGSLTKWLGLVQGTGAIGSLLGYALSGSLTSAGIFYQVAFKVIAILLGVSGLGLIPAPRRFVDMPSPGAGAESGFADEPSAPTEWAAEVRRSARNASISVSYQDGGAQDGSMDHSLLGYHGSRSWRNQVAPHQRSAAPQPEPAEQLPQNPLEQGPDVLETQFSDSMPVSTSGWFGRLIRNRAYRSLVLARCALFFVVSSIQFWFTQYFEECFQLSSSKVHLLFVLGASTGPLFGILMGSSIIDRRPGGYKSIEGQEYTARVSTIWGGLAAFAGAGAAAVGPGPESWRWITALLCIVVQLTFGAAMLPPTTGLVLQSVSEHDRVHATTIAVLLYGLLGACLGNLMPGIVASISRDQLGESQAMSIFRAMQVTFCWAFIGLIGMADAYVVTRKTLQMKTLQDATTGEALVQEEVEATTTPGASVVQA